MTDKILDIARETIETLGYTCVEVKLNIGRHNRILRAVIYKDGKDISTDDCTSVSGVLLRKLEVEIPGFADSHDVIVESPGVDRKITTPEEFRIFKNRDMRIILRDAKKYGLKDNVLIGKILESGPEGHKILSDGKELTVSQADISSARLYFDMKKYL